MSGILVSSSRELEMSEVRKTLDKCLFADDTCRYAFGEPGHLSCSLFSSGRTYFPRNSVELRGMAFPVSVLSPNQTCFRTVALDVAVIPASVDTSRGDGWATSPFRLSPLSCALDGIKSPKNIHGLFRFAGNMHSGCCGNSLR
jgi:hypothetical protein